MAITTVQELFEDWVHLSVSNIMERSTNISASLDDLAAEADFVAATLGLVAPPPDTWDYRYF